MYTANVTRARKCLNYPRSWYFTAYLSAIRHPTDPLDFPWARIAWYEYVPVMRGEESARLQSHRQATPLLRDYAGRAYH